MPSLKCPSCGAALEAHERIGTASLVCGHCHAIVALTGGKARRVAPQSADTAALGSETPLTLGARGTLRGTAVEVTGIIKRADGDYSWYECAIADAAGEVRWLWIDRGHFSLSVCEGKQCVTGASRKTYAYQGRQLRLFNRGTARVVAAVGEFPFELDPSGTPTVIDYIAPPFVASLEDKVWWVFEYVPVAEIEAAFGISCDAPAGIGINQPAPYLRQKLALGIVTVIALIALAVVHSIAGLHAIEAPLVTASVDLHDPKNTPPQSFGPFRLERRWNALDVQVSSAVNNAWTDLDLALVEQSTGHSYWTSQGVEFYSGVDSDGAWTEGGQASSTIIRSIPAGTYMLLAHGQTGTWSAGAPPQSADVQIYDRPAPASNLLLALFAVLVVPGIYVLLARRFAAARWANSDFSPSEESE